MFTLICGPMYSGKTAELIRRARRDAFAGRRVQYFKFAHDARYASADTMASQDGLQTKAHAVTTSDEILRLYNNMTTDVVIDEIQFFDSNIINVVNALTQSGVYVKSAGLTLDFKGEPFVFSDGNNTMADLLVFADDIIQLHAVCTTQKTINNQMRICGKNASRTQRIINGEPAPYDSPVQSIGATEMYEARCRKHHIVPGKPVSNIRMRQCMLEFA